jgi:hypothetical protein
MQPLGPDLTGLLGLSGLEEAARQAAQWRTGADEPRSEMEVTAYKCAKFRKSPLTVCPDRGRIVPFLQ